MNRRNFLFAASAPLIYSGLSARARGASAVYSGSAVGIDVSRNQPVVRWDMLPAVPVHFAILKASQGIDAVDASGAPRPAKDPRFDAHWANAAGSNALRMAHGLPPIILGTYHVFQWNRDERVQAEAFLSIAQSSFVPGCLPPALDVEGAAGNAWNPSYAEGAKERIQTWLRVVATETGKTPIIYTSSVFWSSILGIGALEEDHPLWIARYVAPEALVPDVPAPWSRYTIWQYSDRGRLPAVTDDLGFPIDVDLNLFNGTPDDLAALANGTD